MNIAQKEYKKLSKLAYLFSKYINFIILVNDFVVEYKAEVNDLGCKKKTYEHQTAPRRYED